MDAIAFALCASGLRGAGRRPACTAAQAGPSLRARRPPRPAPRRDKAVRKREEYALRQIQSEGSIRGAGNWSELSLTQPSALSLRSYVLPSVRTGPVIADADRHRVVPVR